MKQRAESQSHITDPTQAMTNMGEITDATHTPGYVKQLEQSVQYLEEKLQKAKDEIKERDAEIANLKDSNENNIFINNKLNKALKKAEKQQNVLESKLNLANQESILLQKKMQDNASLIALQKNLDQQEQDGMHGMPEDPFIGDISSIVVKPDQLEDFNLAQD